VSLVLDSGRSIAEVAKTIGVHEMTLGKWVKKVRESGRVPDKDLSEPERAELERLRKENATLRMERDFAKKSCRLVRERTAVKYATIADWATDKQFTVTFMCAQLGLARQGYYRWLADGCERERTDAELTEQIRDIHAHLHGHPGVRRIWAELVVRGVRAARKRVWRLMRAAGLQGRHPRAWKRTTVAGQRPIDASDLIGQDFTAARPDTRWCGELSVHVPGIRRLLRRL
jgi:transposase-like protein